MSIDFDLGKAEYFRRRDWTGQISLMRREKIASARISISGHSTSGCQPVPEEFMLICPTGSVLFLCR
jgi:hypothetical protein